MTHGASEQGDTVGPFTLRRGGKDHRSMQEPLSHEGLDSPNFPSHKDTTHHPNQPKGRKLCSGGVEIEFWGHDIGSKDGNEDQVGEEWQSAGKFIEKLLSFLKNHEHCPLLN